MQKRQGNNPLPSFFMQLFNFPRMAAVIANTHLFVGGYHLSSFRNKNLDDQCRKGENQPLDGEPPPSNKQPPNNASMLGFKLCFSNHLNIRIGTIALRTNQLFHLL